MACTFCKAKKIRCKNLCTPELLRSHLLTKIGDGGHPCAQCIDRGVRCVVAGSRRRKRREERQGTVVERLSRIENMIQQSSKSTRVLSQPNEHVATLITPQSTPKIAQHSQSHQQSLHSPEETSPQAMSQSNIETTAPEQLDIWHVKDPIVTSGNDALRNLNAHSNSSSNAQVVLDNGATGLHCSFQNTQNIDEIPPPTHHKDTTLPADRNDVAGFDIENVSKTKQNFLFTTN